MYWIVDETNVDWTDWQRDQLVKYYDEFMSYVVQTEADEDFGSL